MQSLEDILHLFSKHQKTNSGYLVVCPIHDDSNPSLHIAIGKDSTGKDRLLVKCFSGCDSTAILNYINENKTKAIFSPKPAVSGKTKAYLSTLVKTYTYRNAGGKMVYQVLRYANPKSFRFRRPTDDLEAYPSGYIWSIDDSDRILYNLDKVITSISTGQYVWKVEGEKDADNLTEIGFTATCNLFGAGSGKWRPEYSAQLENANLICVPDEDESGYIHVFEILKDLITKKSCKSLRLVLLPVSYKCDISDYIESGKPVYDLIDAAIDVSNYTIDQIAGVLSITESQNGTLKCTKFEKKSEYDSILQSDIIEERTVTTKSPVSKLEQTVLYQKAVELLEKNGPMVGLCPTCLGSNFVMGSREDVFGVMLSNDGALISPNDEEHQTITLEKCFHGNPIVPTDTPF